MVVAFLELYPVNRPVLAVASIFGALRLRSTNVSAVLLATPLSAVSHAMLKIR
jgi:hypothetical protein